MPTERRTTAQANEPRQRTPFKRRKPTITIIGAGRLGTALALALARSGYRVEAVLARRLSHARRAAAMLTQNVQALSAAADFDALPPSDLLLITTPDDHIAPVAARLASTLLNKDGSTLLKKGGKARTRVALHCSGALSSEVLSPLAKAGLRVGSMHPLVSISEPVQGAEHLRGAFYCLEGDRAALRVAREVVRDLEGESFSVNRRDKALYHAAAVMASGHMVALFDIAQELLARCGLTAQRARAVLLPLVESTLENLSTRDPAHALTGTFARADAATARRHLDALRKLDSVDALAVYRLLGQRSLRLAEKAGVDRAALQEIRRALARRKK